jgi:DNA-binding transcriptional LysR family regulator
MVLSRRHCSAIALLLRYKYENTIHSFREYCSARVFATAELTMALIEPRDIDLNLLVVFQEVFQERQISSVARPSGAVAAGGVQCTGALRRSFGDELFVRTAQGMQPTPFAEQLAEPVAAALQQVARALNLQEGFAPQSSERRFTIAMTDVGEVYFMPRLIEACAEVAPG